MWSGEFSLSEFLSMLEDRLFRKHFVTKIRASKRRADTDRLRSRRGYKRLRVGWGEKKRKVDKEDVAVRRLREY